MALFYRGGSVDVRAWTAAPPLYNIILDKSKCSKQILLYHFINPK
jgi:hypothetical protein